MDNICFIDIPCGIFAQVETNLGEVSPAYGGASRNDDVRRLAHAAIAEDGGDLSVEDRTAAEVEGGVADLGRGGLVAGDGGAVAVAQLDLVLRDSEVSGQSGVR